MEVDESWQLTLETLEAEFGYSLFEMQRGSFGIGLFSHVPLDNLKLVDIGEFRPSFDRGQPSS